MHRIHINEELKHLIDQVGFIKAQKIIWSDHLYHWQRHVRRNEEAHRGKAERHAVEGMKGWCGGESGKTRYRAGDKDALE